MQLTNFVAMLAVALLGVSSPQRVAAETEVACARACPMIFSPVCGTNGVTYGNRCQLSIAACRNPSIVFASNGACGGALRRR